MARLAVPESTPADKPMEVDREYRKEEDKFVKRAKSEGKLICTICMHQDFYREDASGERTGSLKTYDEYTDQKLFKEVSSRLVEVVNKYTNTKTRALWVDFVCQRNHGNSVELSASQIEQLSPELKKKYLIGENAPLPEKLRK